MRETTKNSYLKKLQNEYKLTNWEIKLITTDLEMYGMCEYDINTGYAEIFISNKLSEEEIKSTIRHELVHLVVARYVQFTGDIIHTYVRDKKTQKILQHFLNIEEETLVTKLAGLQ